MITTETIYVATCDDCGEPWLDDNDCAGHFDKSDTENGLMESEWHVANDGKTYCPKCWKLDEDDNVVVNDIIDKQ
ncbi:hypothetical protein [Emticicia sp. BO119]|uniref:hypothetical protein n=1 Tax=Emticicia sp. BO119 TaxID=2757768 RepID=UPI0015F0BBB6|nr:hypothetical protein [Emticicia sp. BO119]MBA4852050.1 hypothetical protein [Emticicia sp. BO119]